MFKRGDMVYWHDPDGGTCSGVGTVMDTSRDDIIALEMETGGETDARPSELDAYEGLFVVFDMDEMVLVSQQVFFTREAAGELADAAAGAGCPLIKELV